MKLQDYVQNKPILETEQLLLRPLQYDDVADLKEWLSDISILGEASRKKRLKSRIAISKKGATYKEFSLGYCPQKGQ